MSKQLHPNSRLLRIRNVVYGLKARSLILGVLEHGESATIDIAQETEMNYRRVIRHLHLLEDSGIVRRRDSHRPYCWMLTGRGQHRLDAQ